VSSIFLAIAISAFLAAVCVLPVSSFSSTRTREVEMEPALASSFDVASQANVTLKV